MSTFPIYADANESIAVQRFADAVPPSGRGAWVHASEVAFNPAAIDATSATLGEAGDSMGELIHEETIVTRSAALAARRVGTDAPGPSRMWHYQSVTGVDKEIRFVNGAPPRSREHIEVGLSESAANRLGIEVGDRFQLTIPPTDIVHSHATVTGTWEPIDADGEFWQGLYGSLMDPEQGASGGTPPVIALVSQPTLMRLAADSIADLGEIWAIYYVDPDTLREIEINSTLASLGKFRESIARELPDSRTVAGIESALETLRTQLAFNNVATRIAGTLFAAYMLFVILVLVRMVTKARERDRAGLEARGAGRVQVTRTFMLHGITLAAVPAVVGPIMSAILLPLLGRTSGIADSTGGAALSWSLTLEQFAYSATVSVIVATYYFLPVITTRVGPLFTASSRVVSAARPWIWRANLDLLIIVAAAALIYESTRRGPLVAQDGSVSAINALLPVATATVAALVALRAMRLVGTGIGLVGRNPRFPNFATTAKSFARSVMTYSAPMLVAAGAVAVTVMSLGLQDTLTQNASDRASYAAAADIRLTGIDGYQREMNNDVKQIRELPWLEESAWGVRTIARAGTAELAPDFDLLAVQPDPFDDLAWFRPDFATQTFDELMLAIAPYAKPEGFPIPDDAAQLIIDADLTHTGSGRIDLWARISDGTGRTHTLQMERNTDDSSSWSAPVESSLPRPITLDGVQVYEPPVSTLANAAELTLREVQTANVANDIASIHRFNDPSVWHPISSSPVGTTLINSQGDALRVAMGTGNDDGIRGVYYSANGPLEVPILASRSFTDATGLTVGDAFTGNALGRYVPFAIRGTYDLFPSFDSPERPNAVGNVDALLDYIAPVSEPFLGNSVELIATVGSDTDAATRRADIKSVNPAIAVIDKEALQTDASGGLASGIGWRSLGRIVAATAALAGALTLFANGSQFVNEERRNAAVLESVGASRLVLVLDRVFRLGFPVLLGSVAVGLTSGYFGVLWFAGNMTRTEEGSSAVPPLTTNLDWPIVAAVVALVMVAALLPAALENFGRRDSIAARIRSDSSA